jgi:phosphoenolpyruvate---glycerone phosphotransferase subunit DhaL
MHIMSEVITPPQMLQAMEAVCDIIEDRKDYLSDLDGAIGDGDHGVNMAKCFRLVKEKLAETPGEEFETILKNVGMVVLNSVGGAMGALYGTFFMRLSQAVAGKNELGLNDLVRMFQAAEIGILDIGKAKVGDKTLIDTLSPSVRALEKDGQAGTPLGEALTNFEQAAKTGMESTTDLVAKMGRASRLGERTRGHQDAGATSCFFILQAMAKAFTEK